MERHWTKTTFWSSSPVFHDRVNKIPKKWSNQEELNLIAPIQLAKNSQNSKHCGDRYASQLILCDICGFNKNRFLGSLLLFLEFWSNWFTKMIVRISIIIQKISFLYRKRVLRNCDWIFERVRIVRYDPFECTGMIQTNLPVFYQEFDRFWDFTRLWSNNPIFISHFFYVSLILSDDKQ